MKKSILWYLKLRINKRPKRAKDEDRGFSLIELIMVIVIFSIISISIMSFAVPAVSLWSYQNFQQGPATEARLSLKRMVREASEVRNRTGILTANDKRLRFTNVNNNTVDYEYQTGWGELRRDNVAMVKNVSNVVFRYFDQNS